MNSSTWLIQRIKEAGGTVSFFQYMDWVLNDSVHGAYGSGRLSPTKGGDFVTSPSLGNEFSSILASQLNEWFTKFLAEHPKTKVLSLVELGPGEGDMALDLTIELERLSPEIINRIELVMVETNEGMINKQKKKLIDKVNLPVRWSTIEELVHNPVTGIIIANEMLDALPVERILWTEDGFSRIGVCINNKPGKESFSLCQLPLTSKILKHINELDVNLGIKLPPLSASNQWNTEIHVSIEPLFTNLYKILESGTLLIIDYMLEAYRYYNASRSHGTILAYKSQQFSSDLFQEAGSWDLTSHLCIEILEYYASKHGFHCLGQRRQGEALLSLGLAERLSSLKDIPNDQLDIALERRENLLRLVDPMCLGEFRWMAFQKRKIGEINHTNLTTSFLLPPN